MQQHVPRAGVLDVGVGERVLEVRPCACDEGKFVERDAAAFFLGAGSGALEVAKGADGKLLVEVVAGRFDAVPARDFGVQLI